MMSTDHHEGINYMNRSDLNLENLNNNIYYKNNTKYVELIIDIICNHPYNFFRMLKQRNTMMFINGCFQFCRNALKQNLSDS